MSHARLHDAAGLVASSLLVVLTASPGADGACNATCARDIERCMATQCDGTPRAACRRRCKPAAIRTLVYALSECREDAGHSFVGHQALRVRRGDREPITLVEFGPSEPVPDPIGLCQAYARAGFGNESVLMLPLQRLGVSPDGSAVVFEVNDQAPFFRSISLAPEANGFFLVRPDGTGRRRLGPPSRDPSFRVGPEFGKIFPISLGFIFTFAPPVVFSPNGGRIAFTDVGPGPNGEDAVQIVVLDLASGRRTMTHLPSGTPPPVGGNPAVSPFFLTCCPRFLDDDTILFQTYTDPDHLNPEHEFAAFTVRIDGSGLKSVPKPVVPTGSRVIPTFGLVGLGRNLVRLADHPGEKPQCGETSPPLELPITDVFVQQGKDLLQLTNLHCDDTFTGFLSASRSRAFFLASADPLGTNPHRHCQLFSVNSLGGGMRQITHFDLGYRLSYPGCFCPCGIGYGAYRLIVQDPVTKAIVFNTAQDPFHLSAIRLRPGLFSYDQILAMRPDGSGLRQLTDAAGFTTNPDGSIRVELPGPFAYSAAVH